MHFNHIHDLKVIINRGFLVPGNPVVQLPVVARVIDDVIILIKVALCHVLEIDGCKGTVYEIKSEL